MAQPLAPAGWTVLVGVAWLAGSEQRANRRKIQNASKAVVVLVQLALFNKDFFFNLLELAPRPMI